MSWLVRDQKWHARIKVDGKVIRLGDFAVLEDAAQARKAAERQFYGAYSPN